MIKIVEKRLDEIRPYANNPRKRRCRSAYLLSEAKKAEKWELSAREMEIVRSLG